MLCGLYPLLILLYGGIFNPAYADADKTVFTIGVIMDESAGENSDKEVNRYALFVEELSVLTEGEFTLHFPASKRFSGVLSNQQIKAHLSALQHDKDVDMVLALGWQSSQIAAMSPELLKPTFAPFIPNTELLGLLPRDQRSGIKHLNYLSAETQLKDTLKAFQGVAGFTRLAVLVDEGNYNFVSSATHRAVKKAAELGIELIFIAHSRADENLIVKIPQNIEAVMITALPNLSDNSKKALVEGLIARNLPSFNWMGNVTVKQGVLMSTRQSSDLHRLARRNALNMQAVLRGGLASEQTVFFDERAQLTLNMRTARAIGLSLDFDLLNSAVLLHEKPEDKLLSISLSSVAKAAVQSNLPILLGKLGVNAAATHIREARSILFPKLTGDISYVQANADHPFVEIGLNAEKRTQLAIRLEQVLFSERSLANLAIQKHLLIAEKAQQQALELDIVQGASTTFLNILIAQTQHEILLNNLKLTQAHLVLAKNREAAGAVNIADVYRWQSEQARARQQVLLAASFVEQAQDALNLILHRPISSRFSLQSASLDDPSLFILHKSVLGLISNERDFEKMSQFFVEEGLRAAPELTGLVSQINAQSRQLQSEQRGAWLPDIGLFGEIAEVVDETLAQSRFGLNISLEDERTWQAGIRLSLPLFEGGARHARVERSKLNLQQMSTRQTFARENIEQGIRQQMHAIHASYPAIKLSKQAAESARQSYEIVKDNYSNGTLSVTAMLDAQTASIAAEQAAAKAVYTFLIDLMKLQRSVGHFDFFLSELDHQGFAKRLTEHMAHAEKQKIEETQ